MKLIIEPQVLQNRFNIDGTDERWRRRIREFCRQHALNVEKFVKAAASVVHETLGRGRLKSQAHRVWAAFNGSKKPKVPEWLRRITAFLESIARRNEPLPIAT